MNWALSFGNVYIAYTAHTAYTEFHVFILEIIAACIKFIADNPLHAHTFIDLI